MNAAIWTSIIMTALVISAYPIAVWVGHYSRKGWMDNE